MLRNHFTYQANSQVMSSQFSSSGNPLGIDNTEFIWDRKTNNLVVLTETSQMIGKEIKAIMKDNRLLLEAPIVSSYDRPIRTHLMGKDLQAEFEDGLTEIGFSEIDMESGYQYSLVSCFATDSNRIKVILNFRPEGRFKNN